jgi:hypothetical protein
MFLKLCYSACQKSWPVTHKLNERDRKKPKKQDIRAPIEQCRAKVPLNNEEETGGTQLHQCLAVEESNLEGVAGEDRGVWPPEPGHQQYH